MKKLLVMALVSAAFVAVAQPRKGPKMEPVTEEGYYIGTKNDTVRGEVQSNPDDPTEFYTGFKFKPAKGGKLMPVSSKKAKAYGFGDRHFVVHNENGVDLYLERLVHGRINLFKRQFNGKVDGYPGIETEYYAQDTRADGGDAGLKEIRKISTKFYKRDLKNYLKDQPMIWSDLDKFNFDENKLMAALNEFNNFYTVTAD